MSHFTRVITRKHNVCTPCRQQRELADVELARLTAETQVSAAKAADTQGLLAAAEARASKKVEAASAAQIKVCHKLTLRLPE